jgi:hypothetical protein
LLRPPTPQFSRLLAKNLIIETALAACKILAAKRCFGTRCDEVTETQITYLGTPGDAHESRHVTKRRKRFDNKWSSALSSQRNIKL